MVAYRADVEELFRLSTVERGMGRVVRRFIERFVEQNEFEVRMDLPRSWVLLDMACFVAEVREYIAGSLKAVSKSESGGLEWVTSLELFPWTSMGSVSYVVKLREVPATMLERQRMLKEIYQSLDLVLSLHDEWTRDESTQWMREQLLGDELKNVDEKQGGFNMAVMGIYTHVENLGERYAALAAVLNSQVASVMPESWNKTVKIEWEELEPA
jgi:hypothetical protein